MPLYGDLFIYFCFVFLTSQLVNGLMKYESMTINVWAPLLNDHVLVVLVLLQNNGGMEPNINSLFFQKNGMTWELSHLWKGKKAKGRKIRKGNRQLLCLFKAKIHVDLAMSCVSGYSWKGNVAWKLIQFNLSTIY